MNALYATNYLIFSIFFTLFTLELGVALTLLTDRRAEIRDRLHRFIAPLWQIIGTFAVFYLINFEATYPQLLGVVGYAYILPLMFAALSFIIRNAFISYAGYSSDGKYIKIYGSATVITYFLALSAFTSAVSGIGINVAGASIDLFTVLFNPFNLMVFVGLAALALFSVRSFFQIIDSKITNIVLGIASLVLLVVAAVVYLPFILQNAFAYYLLAALLIIFAAHLFLSLRGNRISKPLSILWPVIVMLAFGVLNYPNVFGDSGSLLTYMTNTASGFWVSVISAVGGALLILYMFYFLRTVYMGKTDLGSKGY